MHLSSHLFSVVFLTELVLALAVTNESTLYFPTNDNKGYAQASYGSAQERIEVSPTELESLRGTTMYDKYVTDIIAKGISRLTVTLNKLLTHQTRSSNVVFSPLSISSALSLILLGSNGVTFKELSEFMGLAAGIPDLNKRSQVVHEQFSKMLYKLDTTSGFSLGEQINVATAIFVQTGYPIRPLYKSTAEELYQSSIVNVDFSGNPRLAQQQVNQWVESHTNAKIKNILNDLPSSDTKVILASALYFNAEWENHFFAGTTRRRQFFVNGRNQPSLHELDMMSNGGDFPYYRDNVLGCEILGLPYKGNKSTMYVIMPFDSSLEKLHQFETKVTEHDLENLVSKTKLTGTVILFPKMKIESTFDLRRTLEVLGVKSLFDPHQANLALLSPGEFTYRVDTAQKPTVVAQSIDSISIKTSPQSNPLSSVNNSTAAQLSRQIIFSNRLPETPVIGNRISHSLDNIRDLLNKQSADNHFQNPGLYADQVIHKVYIDVTEKGTEAAAATSVSLSRDGSRVTFRVDVPFLFFIRHEETKTILFWGSVTVPTPNYPSSK